MAYMGTLRCDGVMSESLYGSGWGEPRYLSVKNPPHYGAVSQRGKPREMRGTDKGSVGQ